MTGEITSEEKTPAILCRPNVLTIDELANSVPAKLTLTTVLTKARESEVGKLKNYAFRP